MKRLSTLLVLILSVFLIISIGCEKLKEEGVSQKKADTEKATGKKADILERSRVHELPSFADLVEKLKPSVVNISTTSTFSQRGLFPKSPFGEENPFEEFFKRFFGDIPQQDFKQSGLGY